MDGRWWCSSIDVLIGAAVMASVLGACDETLGPCGGAHCTIEEACYDCEGVEQCAAQPVSCADGITCRYPWYVLTCGGASKCVRAGTAEYLHGCCGDRFCESFCGTEPCESPKTCIVCDMVGRCVDPGTSC